MKTDALPMIVHEGASCAPNISAAGRRQRIIGGHVGAALSILCVALCLYFQAPWYARAFTFFPLAMMSFSYLQARKNTCVARAREGTFENNDFSKVPASVENAAASRRVAAGIQRDALLIAAAGTLIAVATVFIR